MTNKLRFSVRFCLVLKKNLTRAKVSASFNNCLGGIRAITISDYSLSYCITILLLMPSLSVKSIDMCTLCWLIKMNIWQIHHHYFWLILIICDNIITFEVSQVFVMTLGLFDIEKRVFIMLVCLNHTYKRG